MGPISNSANYAFSTQLDARLMEKIPVTILDRQGQAFSGLAEITILNAKQAFWAGAKKSLKVIGVIGGVALPFAFLEPFLFLVWGSALAMFLVLFLGPYLHMYFASEKISFKEVVGSCLYCHDKGPLKPYLSTRFQTEFTVLCSECGESVRVRSTSDKTPGQS
jgi:hypothetical protein